MVAASTLRILATSSPSLYQPPRFQYAGGMGAIPTIRVAASASPALRHARRLSYADGIGASLRVVAQASQAVAPPLRFPYAVFPFPGSLCPASAAAARGLQARCFPPGQPDGTDDVRKEELRQASTTPRMRGWGPLVSALSSKTSKRPVVHLLAVLLFSGVKSSEFRGVVEAAGIRFKFPPRLTVGILLGAAAIAVLFDIAVMGKDINEVYSYLMTHGPKIQEDDS